MKQHTPEPWEAVDTNIVSNGLHIGKFLQNGFVSLEAALANTKLAVCAPGMLEALKSIGSLDEAEATSMSNEFIRGWAYAAARIARAEIEKAEGQS